MEMSSLLAGSRLGLNDPPSSSAAEQLFGTQTWNLCLSSFLFKYQPHVWLSARLTAAVTPPPVCLPGFTVLVHNYDSSFKTLQFLFRSVALPD